MVASIISLHPVGDKVYTQPLNLLLWKIRFDQGRPLPESSIYFTPPAPINALMRRLPLLMTSAATQDTVVDSPLAYPFCQSHQLHCHPIKSWPDEHYYSSTAKKRCVSLPTCHCGRCDSNDNNWRILLAASSTTNAVRLPVCYLPKRPASYDKDIDVDRRLRCRQPSLDSSELWRKPLSPRKKASNPCCCRRCSRTEKGGEGCKAYAAYQCWGRNPLP
jgi:hypothetical protein